MAYYSDSGITPAWLDELKSKVDIVQLIGSSVALTRKGSKWWACCPFHHEKTASFAVDEGKGIFYCFGCHEGGDVISWVMKTDDMTYIEALKYLARQVGMKVPESQLDIKDAAKRERLYEMMRQAALHYYKNFQSNAQARAYMQGRGLRDETLRRFGIGYSVGGHALIDALSQAGYTLKEMESCSLIGIDAERGTQYDFLSGRIIVPIFDALGHVIAFGGRVMEKREGVAKYKNTRETELFQKNRVLYGLNFVKKYRLHHAVDSLIIVEGYMDVIALVEAGFANAVASMGTALTESQAALIKRTVGKVYICYDGDAAGQSSTMRGLDILKKTGLDVRVVNLPDGLDPDEIIRQRGREAYQRCLDEALPLYEHKIVRAAARYDLTSADGRGAYAKECLRIIGDLDAVEQDAYLDLISQRTAVSKAALSKMVVRTPEALTATPAAPTRAATPSAAAGEDSAYIKACRFMLMLMLVRPDYTNDWLPGEYYSREAHSRVAAYVLDCMVDKQPIVPSNIYHIGVDADECSAIINTPMPAEDELERAYTDSRRYIEREHVAEQIKQLTAAFATASGAEEQRMLLQQIQQLKLRQKNLK